MRVFGVFGITDSDAIAKAVAEAYPDDHLAIDENSFLVAADDATTKDVGTRLGFAEEEPAALGIVARFDAFWGFHHAHIWEWIGVKAQKNGS